MTLPTEILDDLRARARLMGREPLGAAEALDLIRATPPHTPIPDRLAEKDPDRKEFLLFTRLVGDGDGDKAISERAEGEEPISKRVGEWYLGNDGHPVRFTILEYAPKNPPQLEATTETALAIVPKAEPPALRRVAPAPVPAVRGGLGEFYDHLPGQKRGGWRWRRWLR